MDICHMAGAYWITVMRMSECVSTILGAHWEHAGSKYGSHWNHADRQHVGDISACK